MKRLLLLLVVFTTATVCGDKKYELKANPISLLFGSYDISTEYMFDNSWSAETYFSYAQDNDLTLFNFDEYQSYEVSIAGKHYFNSEKPGNRGWLIGSYLKYQGLTIKESDSYDGFEDESYEFIRNSFNIGFFLGYKWISTKNILVQFDFGLGRVITEDTKFVSGNRDAFESSELTFPVDGFFKFRLGYRINN